MSGQLPNLYLISYISDKAEKQNIFLESIQRQSQLPIKVVMHTFCSDNLLGELIEKQPSIILLDLDSPKLKGRKFYTFLLKCYRFFNPEMIFLGDKDALRKKEKDLLNEMNFEVFSYDDSKILSLIKTILNQKTDINKKESLNHIYVPFKNNLELKIKTQDIAWLESFGVVTYINLTKAYQGKLKLPCFESLGKLSETLPNNMFFRVHKKYTINKNNVSSPGSPTNPKVIMINEEVIPVSRRNIKAFYSWIKK